ncbi:MAG: DUF1801 domain-containing protein [Pseudomonadota bacterium]
MLYDVKNQTEYIKGLEDDWRLEKLQKIRKLIKKNVPGVKEVINYKMLGYDYKEDKIFHLNAQKAYVGLYVCNTKRVDPDGSLLNGINCGKGCIRFKKTTTISVDNLTQLIKNAVQISDQGIKNDC